MNEIKLIQERYEGSILKRDETIVTNMAVVLDAIGRLDGKRQSLMSLVDDTRHEVVIIGGGPDLFVAQRMVDIDREMYCLVAEASEPGKKKVVVGGQGGWYDTAACQTKDQVENAASSFLENRSLPSGLFWRRR